MYNRFIPLTHEGVAYDCIRHLIDKNKDCEIKHDYDNFEGTPPQDHHPSRKCHQIMAENVINSIKYDQDKKLTNPPIVHKVKVKNARTLI